jgi:predicted methyltransferase
MPRQFVTVATVLGLLAIAQPACAQDGEADLVATKLRQAMASPARGEKERARDANRKPIETLAFFGLTSDMRVLELVPGSGWYTRLLAPVLKDEGKLYVAVGTSRLENGLLKEEGFGEVEVVSVDADFAREGRRNNLSRLEMELSDIDLALTFRNLHNFTEAGRATMNKAVFEALRPGGHYGVVDHTRRHMAADSYEHWRRMDPVQMIKEIEAAGFEFVDYSTLHYRPDDELRFEVGRKSVTGNTDRFTLLFRKPE